MKFSAKKTGKLVAAGATLAVLVAANVVAGIYSPQITNVLCGTGDNFDAATETLELSDELCRKMGEESIVLLRNENQALPISDLNKVNLFGWGATDEGFLLKGVGSGSSTISEAKAKTLIDAFEEAEIEVNQDILDVYANFYSSNRNSVRQLSGSATYKLAEPAVSAFSDDLIASAKASSDVAIFVISRCGGENIGDLPAGYLDISAQEKEMLTFLKGNFSKVIVLLNTTNTMHTGFLEELDIDAALYVGITGQSAAIAIPEIITGQIITRYDADGNVTKEGAISPSGVLADTVAYYDQYDPTYANIAKGSNQYVEDIYYGYKWYETANEEGYFDGVETDFGTGYEGVVQYPFGYGLSYTDFEWELGGLTVTTADGVRELDAGATINLNDYEVNDKFTVTVNVTNVGDYAGKDVVQLYNTAPYIRGEVEKAHVNLIDFAKTPEIGIDEGVNNVGSVTLSFTPYDLASYDAYDKNGNGSATYELDEGTYQIKIMTDAHSVATMDQAIITFEASEDIVIATDPVSGEAIENRLTGEGAYAGLSIDGLDIGAATYMTREDFVGTFPTTQAARPNGAIINTANQFLYDEPYLDLPNAVTEEDNGLYLATLADGSKASKNQLEGKLGGEELVWNYELMEDLMDYDSETWELVLNQLTASEMETLIEQAGFRRIALESVGKPRQYDYDGPAGFNTNSLTGSWDGVSVDTATWTAYPSEALIGCSWNKDLMFELGRSMGAEANATSIDGWYAPGVNLHRNAYLGRNFEYYSEDGVLSGKLAAKVIYGAKTNGLSCYVKHFVCSDSGDNPRGTDTWLTEQNLRENALKPFELCVKEGGANAIMSAFNDIGSVWCGANYALLNEILRGEWGFRGMVLTDWTSGASRGGMDVQQGIRCGNDLWLNPNAAYSGGMSISNATDMKAARVACHNILYAVVDTEYSAEQYRNMDLEDIYQTSGSIGFKEEVFPWWIILLVAIDVVAAAGIGFWTFKILKKED